FDRRGTSDHKAHPAERKMPVRDPSACERCGAIFSRKTWRRYRRVDPDTIRTISWTVCRACRQVERDEGFGKVVADGAFARANREAMEKRIRNVEQGAEFTQPEHRISSIDWDGADFEIITTSQRLAHRIALELA